MKYDAEAGIIRAGRLLILDERVSKSISGALFTSFGIADETETSTASADRNFEDENG